MDSRLQAAAHDFAKDTAKENNGVWAPYKSREYRIARAHRNNVGFSKTVESQMRPYRRLIESGNQEAMKDKAAEVLQSIYASSVLLGIKDAEGEIPYTAADGVELFKMAPDLWDFVFRFANAEDNYALEQETKN